MHFAQTRIGQRLDGETRGENRRGLMCAAQIAGEQESRRILRPCRGELLHRAESRGRQRNIGLAQTQSRSGVDIAMPDENQIHWCSPSTGAAYHCVMETCDVLIVGGGLVGASLAIALDRSGLSVALAESAAPRVDAQPSYDERNLALAQASVNALTALGVWTHLSTLATPIRKIHISRQGEFGAVRLDAKQHDLDAFGAVVPARELGNALLRRLDACADLQRFAPATVQSIDIDATIARQRICRHADGDARSTRVCSSARTARIRSCAMRSASASIASTTSRPLSCSPSPPNARSIRHTSDSPRPARPRCCRSANVAAVSC